MPMATSKANPGVDPESAENRPVQCHGPVVAGLGPVQRNQFEKAIQVWQKLAPQLEPDSEDAKTLNESIDAAYARLGKKPTNR